MTTATTEKPSGEPARAPRRRRPGRGARTRILAWVIGLLVASTALTLVVERQILVGRVGDRVDDSLDQEIREFRRLVDQGRNPLTGRPFGNDVGAIFDVFLRRNVPGEGETFFTFLDGRPYRASDPDADPAIVRRMASLSSVERVERGELDSGSGKIRYLAVPVRVDARDRGVFAVTVELGDEEDEVRDVLQVNLLVALGVLLAASALAFLAVGRVLAPLRAVAETARSIGETDLSRRIVVEGDDEIADLANTFNAMLDRLEEAFATQRAFVSDAGHELRTPITIIRGHLELLAAGDAPREEVLEIVSDELGRMSRLVEDLLLLAKSQRPNFLHLQHVDLDVLTEEIYSKASALGDRDWTLEETGVGRLRADRQRLTQAAMNLLANAAEHTETGARISLGSEIRDGEARLWVSDTGPGVPHGEHERIFERFARGPDAQRRADGADGAGLGLAITRAIVEGHGGRVELHSTPGEGATFTIVIPTGEEGE